MRTPLSLIILTYNEEKNIEKCLESVLGLAADIFIVDSYSTDRTLEIAGRYTDKIYRHEFEDHSRQINWALENLPINTPWIMRLDADEVVLPGLKEELLSRLPVLGGDVTGLYIKRRVYFMGRWIRHGGYYPVWLLRVWRKGKGFCEDKSMDEHIKVDGGRTLFLKNDLADENKKPLDWWIKKHNNYATREVMDAEGFAHSCVQGRIVPERFFGAPEQRKKWFKKNIYYKLPLFMRASFYFSYRYFMLLGFLDGKEGLIWHFLQGFWYRFLVDAKIYEIKKRAESEKRCTAEIIKDIYSLGAEK